ncbi:phosphate ABC transporter permease subunit PstC [Palleronia caenipelagi]|uniref:Phosphate transport system permease protein n=1 Tax=Palleronia caenipelagi TaxID=2489174 RepID=A0A547Q607_9RHOB|nr:phosphate ABC transporter permease subunit PstC [Palleronia caenipelagi]TRD21819.1 phosphate ABC transporter permease subunit PstC [Palleronia caenipelagi]
MSPLWTPLFILALAIAGFFAARSRALSTAGGNPRLMHSLPRVYGMNALIWTAAPALLLLAALTLAQPMMQERQVMSALPDSLTASAGETSLAMAEICRIAGGIATAIENRSLSKDAALQSSDIGTLRDALTGAGIAVTPETSAEILNGAQDWYAYDRRAALLHAVLALGAAALGLVWALRRARKDVNARSTVERGILLLLMGAASVAILTTVGIVFSMLFEAYHFFQQYSWREFFFSTNWNPRFQGGSDLGMLPLLWGTLYISLIALIGAVPIGLFAAIYLSEYASRRMRSIAKPLIEVLAGVPTIVYGLFALITVGPILRDYFAAPMGLGNSASSVMTAGLVMGIMLIPFVSSLSDDIINAVPQSLRDGSYGLGSTQSETVRHVVLPAALPGIVGAILLAASRAIGETMIVVLGAGAAAKLSMNPFEAMTTVTVKIVSQLTGDTDFASPETLVAFALGLTLFVLTLILNVIALYVVRKYREQYE